VAAIAGCPLFLSAIIFFMLICGLFMQQFDPLTHVDSYASRNLSNLCQRNQLTPKPT